MHTEPEVIEIETPSDEPGVSDDASIATRTTVRELVAVFEQAERDVRTAFATIAAAEKRVNDAFTLGAPSYREIRVNPSREKHHSVDFGDADRAVERMAREAWKTIVERLDVRRVLSAKRAKELDDRLEKGELPPITEEAVYAFANEYRDVRGFFEEKVAEVFDWLRPREGSWRFTDYKTNQKNAKLELGPKVVLTGMVHASFMGRNRFGGRFDVDYDDKARLVALEAVFRALDGKGWGTKEYEADLVTAIEAAPDGHAETEYFEVRAFKNRSLHVRFVRLDLLHRLNQIAGGRNLRPNEAA